MFRPSFLGLVYIVVGVAVAASYDYFKNLDTFRRIASAVLAVFSGRCCCSGSTSTSGSKRR